MGEERAGAAAARSERIASLDLLRGIVMVVMALDHCRDFFGGRSGDPTDLDTTTPGLFLTRWVTHFCAPVFVLLAGTSASLHGRGRPRGELARFLAARGVWLIALEFTLVHLGWFLGYSGALILQVIAAIGAAMLALAGLVFLPRGAIAAIGLAIVLGHDALDGVHASEPGSALGILWTLLHEAFAAVRLPGGTVLVVIYPLLPWTGVLACGYALGGWIERPRAERARLLARLGLALVLGFAVLRAANGYGDPAPWERRESALLTVFSFVNAAKYPPSLVFLAMTLGPALLLLAAVERADARAGARTRLRGALETFGRVPLFYYVLHLYLAHLGAALWFRLHEGQAFPFSLRGPSAPWQGLGVVYAGWLAVVVLLYPLCRWYAGVKRKSRSRLLSYL